jgi:hypothetical protein
MTLTDWIAELRAAGVVRVTLDLVAPLHPITPTGSFHADQAPRPTQVDANAQAESHIAQPEKTEEVDPEQQARDLELMHSE